jgi:hypothetical protein
MLIGADVSHPPPGNQTKPSLATLTASIDKYATKYVAAAANQKNREEMTTNLSSMAEFCVQAYIRYHEHEYGRKMMPKRVIYYRDGVSEGQFGAVLSKELPQIKDGLKRAQLPPLVSSNVKITICIVRYAPKQSVLMNRKRHHTRFAPVEMNESDKTGNCPPGTVVDQHITHPTEWDWFHIPHSAVRGTVRPTHYHVIYDENNFNSNELQQFSNDLSYLYCRSSTAVSLVPPVYHAHLAGNRARSLDPTSIAPREADSIGGVPSLQSLSESVKYKMWWV